MSTQKNILLRLFAFLGSIFRGFRALVLNLLFLFFVVVLFASIFGPSVLPLPEEAILVLDPAGIIVEQSAAVSSAEQLLDQQGNAQIELADLLKVIIKAGEDPRITAMIIEPADIQGAAFSHLQELGSALSTFKSTGKRIYAVSGNYSQAQYYLASFANQILLNPMGTVDLQGFGTWQIYFKTALDTLGVNAHVFRVGTYKAAVEPYERDSMSDEARQNYSDLFGDLWDMYLRDVSEQRNLPQNALSELIETYDQTLASYAGDTSALALGEGLIDQIGSLSGNLAYINSSIGGDANPLPRVDFKRYLRTVQSKPQFDNRTPQIGLITASGEIRDGEAPRGSIGGETLANLIQEATKNQALAALVLRIDSPGGSAFASELIRGELNAFKATGRPLLVSMGSVAASGGYWISTPADEIWASASTITGSIGIYGVLPTFETTFARLGLTLDGTGTTSLSGTGAIGKELNPLVERSMQLTIESGYRRFINLVAESRAMSIEGVDSVAQGQVWSGMQALNNGLVDQLGSLAQTIAAAAARAELDTWQVIPMETPLGPFELFLASLMDNQQVQGMLEFGLGPVRSPFFTRMLKPLEQLFEIPDFLNDPNAAYLHCEACRQASF